MKVIVIGPGPEFLSGISYYTWKLCNTLDAIPILFRDMLPKFLFPGKERVGKVENKIQYTNCEVKLDWWNPITWMKAVRECNRHDVVVLQWWSVSVAHMYAFILAFCKAKVIIEIHETIDPLESSIMPIRAYSKAIRRWCWGKADRLVVHSKMDLCQVGCEYDDVSLIPHGVYDQYKDRDLKLKDGEFCVLFFGLVRDYKGVKYLIEGFKKADLANSCLFVQGEQWDKLPDPEHPHIHFLERYADDRWVEVMFSYADVVVLPYLRASSSGVAHIAMHYGLPIIATNTGGLADLSDYEGMFYVAREDSDGIADRLKLIHSQYRGRRFPVPERLQWSEIKKEWISVLSTVSTAR